jgi:hypothetical protein
MANKRTIAAILWLLWLVWSVAPQELQITHYEKPGGEKITQVHLVKPSEPNRNVFLPPPIYPKKGSAWEREKNK